MCNEKGPQSTLGKSGVTVHGNKDIKIYSLSIWMDRFWIVYGLNKSPGIFHLQAFTEVTEVCEIRVGKKEH